MIHLKPAHLSTTDLLWLGDPLTPHPTLREALWLNRPRPRTTPRLPPWARAANRRPAARRLPITTRAHARMLHTHRPWARLVPAC